MKHFKISVAFILAIVVLSACNKSNNSNPNPSGGGKLVRIFQGTDPDILNDTVNLITYDQAGRIQNVVDSINLDTLAGTYDANGNLASVTGSGAGLNGYSASFVYDASNHLTEIDAVVNGEAEQSIFEYSAGVVSKRSYYTNGGSGPVSLYRYFTYTVSNGNITSMNTYQADGTLLGTLSATYGAQANPYSVLCLFNFSGSLGIDVIAPLESYFNKNILTGTSASGTVLTSVQNIFNNNQKISKAIGNDLYADVYTWQFFYK
jgi:hypothetical protein